MEVIKIILLAIALVSLAVFGLATKILLKRGGKFPNSHVSGNKYLRSEGITCAQSFDKIEQAKAKQKIKFQPLTLNDTK